MSEPIEFLPYGRQSIDEDDIRAVAEVLRSSYLTTGPAVAEFEEKLAEKVGARYAVAVSNGTAALHAACFAAEVGSGDEVVVPAITFLASANCARYMGGEPRFVDVSADDALIRIDDIERQLSPRTKAIIPVHMTGRSADTRAVAELARKAGAMVIEDAAHALGARYEGKTVGCCEHSDMAIFSFHPVKHVTTGEGGAIVTNDARLYERLRIFRNHGMVHDDERFENESEGPWYHEMQELGYNYRLTDIHCALGTRQLSRLDSFVQRRREIAALYVELLADLPHVSPLRGSGTDEGSGFESSYHLFVALIDFEAAATTRKDVMSALRERRIGTQVHYIPVPSQPYYRRRGWNMDGLDGAVGYYRRALSLPCYYDMSDDDVRRVVGSLRDVLGN